MKYALYILTALQVLGFVSSLFITGSIVSAFNDSAKGFLYMTIVWVIYFAFRYLFTKSSKKEFSFKVFRGWLLREDLNLEKRWWHRLFLVFSVLIFLFVNFNLIDWTLRYNNQYSRQESLSSLAGDTLESLASLGGKKDYIISDDFPHQNINYYGFDVYKNITYCSNKITEEKIDSALRNNQNVSVFYLKNTDGKRFLASKDSFYGVVNKYNLKCIVLDSFTNFDDSKTYFWTLPDNEYYFYKFSYFKTGIEILKIVLLSSLGFLAVITFYYKVLLYIIFGSKKNDH